MVTHAKEFRLLADIEMISQILLIGSFVQAVDQILKKFTGAVRSYLVNDLNTRLTEEFSSTVRGVEHKGEIIQPEGLFVVATVHQVVFLALLHRNDHHIIGDEGKEYFFVLFAYTLCFLDAP